MEMRAARQPADDTPRRSIETLHLPLVTGSPPAGAAGCYVTIPPPIGGIRVSGLSLKNLSNSLQHLL